MNLIKIWTIKYLYKKDEKKFILKELENDSKIKEKFIKVLTKLTYYRNEFGELKETTPDSTDSIFIRLVDKIFDLIKIKIEIEGDFRGDDFEEEKLFYELFSILNENSDYYENNKNLRYCEIKCIYREEKFINIMNNLNNSTLNLNLYNFVEFFRKFRTLFWFLILI